jgi:hypothetical protein
MADDFLANYPQFLVPSRWTSRNGVLSYSILPVWGLNFDSSHIYAELESLLEIYEPFRLQVQCVFLIFNNTTSEYKFFYASANTRIHEQPFLYVYKGRKRGCLRAIRATFEKSEKQHFLNTIIQSYAENSSDTNIAPVYLKFQLVCPSQNGAA